MAAEQSGTNGGVSVKAEPIVDEVAKKIILTDTPACEVLFHEEQSIATRRPTEITSKDFTKALLVPILISCHGCEKSFPGPARFTELLMHLCSKQHSKGCAVPIDENPLYNYAVNHFSDSDNPQAEGKPQTEKPAKKARTAATTTQEGAAKAKNNADKGTQKENAKKAADVNPQSSWIVCYICNIVTSNEGTYESHVAGKRHKSMLPHATDFERANPRGPYIVDGAPVIDITRDRKKLQPPTKNQPGPNPGAGAPPQKRKREWFQQRGPRGFPPQMGGGDPWDEGFGPQGFGPQGGGANIPPPSNYGGGGGRQNQPPRYDGGFGSPRFQGGGGFRGGDNFAPPSRFAPPGPRNGPPRYPNAQMDTGYWPPTEPNYYDDDGFYGGPDYGPPPPRGYRYENYGRLDTS